MRLYRAGSPKAFPRLNEKFYIVQSVGSKIDSFTTFGPFDTADVAEQFCNTVGGAWVIHEIGRVR